ncbi:bromodomain-containing protein [Skeletonema marinoi]|uniref:Bromodomain-containing protein n=1 Tax=Skeletonema marinoi TaxID=267567 RepID=A0AAD9D8N0_9STRA|nr:bromodomain-containing protein [Skeletonema marinoi]
MSSSAPEWQAMSKLVSQVYAKADAEPFREPVDWKALGLFDYPQVIKKPMDLGLIKKKLHENKYKSIHDAADDVRLIWKNCMTYNADGSDFYNLAQTMAKKFEEKFEKLCAQNEVAAAAGGGDGGAAASGGSGVAEEPTIEEKRAFAKSLYKIGKDDLGKVIMDLDVKCPKSLIKNSAEDEVEINVDLISPAAFAEVREFVNEKVAEAGGAAGGKKKKTAKRARNQ